MVSNLGGHRGAGQAVLRGLPYTLARVFFRADLPRGSAGRPHGAKAVRSPRFAAVVRLCYASDRCRVDVGRSRLMRVRITMRDVVVAVVAAGATLGVVAYAQEKPAAILKSTVFDWNSWPVRNTDVGQSRQVVRQPTLTLDELEMHVTTLNPGVASHPPHKHTNEELLILKEGTLEALVDGQWKKVGPGSIVFQASNSCHGVRNVGTTSATYHIVNWSSPGKLKTNGPAVSCTP